jgi:ribosomal protein S5
MNLTPSPTGTPVIPPAAVPYVLALVGILAVAADTVEAGPITVSSVLRASVRALTLLAVGALPGLRR